MAQTASPSPQAPPGAYRIGQQSHDTTQAWLFLQFRLASFFGSGLNRLAVFHILETTLCLGLEIPVLLGRPAEIHGDVRSRDAAGAVGAQEGDHFADLLRL